MFSVSELQKKLLLSVISQIEFHDFLLYVMFIFYSSIFIVRYTYKVERIIIHIHVGIQHVNEINGYCLNHGIAFLPLRLHLWASQ